MSPVSKYPVTLVTLFRLSHLSAAIEYTPRTTPRSRHRRGRSPTHVPQTSPPREPFKISETLVPKLALDVQEFD